MEDRIPGRLQHRHMTCCEKGGRHGRQACRVQRWHHCGDVVFQTGGLVYDNGLQRISDTVLVSGSFSPSGHLFGNGTLLTTLSQFPTFDSTPLSDLLQTVVPYLIPHSLEICIVSIYYL